MGNKKDIRKLNRKIKSLKSDLKAHEAKTNKHIHQLELILTEFNAKLSSAFTSYKKKVSPASNGRAATKSKSS